MVNYICPKCNKEFNKKSHYIEHTENKKKPCDKSDFLVPPKSAKIIDIIIKEDILTKKSNQSNSCTCTYCNKAFTRIDSLKKHLNGRCKSKENYNELENLKDNMKLIIDNNKNFEKRINRNTI